MQCPICFDGVFLCENKLVAWQCGHLLCKRCAKKIIATTRKCHICRKSINCTPSSFTTLYGSDICCSRCTHNGTKGAKGTKGTNGTGTKGMKGTKGTQSEKNTVPTKPVLGEFLRELRDTLLNFSI